MTWHGYAFDRLFRWIFSSVAGVSLFACGSSSTQPAGATVRVVSLSPGMTATMIALGASDRLVGRTPWCEVSENVPIVGTLLDLNAEALVLVQPTLILLQPPAQGEVAGLNDLASKYGWRVERFRIDSLADVQAMLETLPKVICDTAVENDCAQLAARAQLLQRELTRALEPLPEANFAGRTLVLLLSDESADAMGIGRNSYIGDALERMGATNALARNGYPSLGAEDLAKLVPDTVVVITKQSAAVAAAAVEQLARIMPKSLVYSINAPELLQPGAGMIPGLIKLREALTQAGRASQARKDAR